MDIYVTKKKKCVSILNFFFPPKQQVNILVPFTSC